MKSLIFLIFALLFNQSLTQNQLSVVGPLSTIAFGCFKDIGYTWSIIRAYHISTSPGAVDVNAAETMINSETAGIPVDAYMVICRNNDPVSQIYTLFSTIDNNLFGDLWIKVEPNSTPGCQWGNNTADNCMFLTEAIAVAQLYKKTIGVFSTATIWNNFFGNSCNIATSSIPLWYADYNATGHVNPTLSYSDFIPFGGWTTPFMKQVGGNVTVSPLCGHSLWHALIDQIYWTAPV